MLGKEKQAVGKTCGRSGVSKKRSLQLLDPGEQRKKENETVKRRGIARTLQSAENGGERHVPACCKS